MDDQQVDILIESEREWRRYLVKETQSIRKELAAQGKEIEKLKVWTWISRGAIGTAFGLLLAWAKSKFESLQ